MIEPGDEFLDDDGTIWRVVGEHRYIEVEVDEDPESDEPFTTQTSQWPAESIEDKVGDDLEPLPPVDDDPDEETVEVHQCDTCGKAYDTQQGLAGHQPCEPE